MISKDKTIQSDVKVLKCMLCQRNYFKEEADKTTLKRLDGTKTFILHFRFIQRKHIITKVKKCIITKVKLNETVNAKQSFLLEDFN